MTNAEALAECARQAADLEAAIAAGEIPPRPDATFNGEAWRAWYDAHVRCATVTHQFMQRERGTKFCKACLARMTNAETSASVIDAALARGETVDVNIFVRDEYHSTVRVSPPVARKPRRPL